MRSRREIKNLMNLYSGASGCTRPLVVATLDVLLCGLALAAVVVADSWWMKAILGTFLGCCIARLFVVGHDACHGSFTPSPMLNRWIGRVAFLPSLTAYSVWEVGHNIAHHSFNNLRGRDTIWEPVSVDDFDHLPWWRRTAERVYRSGWVPGVYYLVEVWWTKMFFPSQAELPTRRPEFIRDNIAVAVFAVVWISGLVGAAAFEGVAPWQNLFFGFVLPQFVWNSVMGFVVYVQHTHPKVKWYSDKAKWTEDRAFLTGTVHVEVPRYIGAWLHDILDHTAHHVDMSVPFEKLRGAQRHLETEMGEHVVMQPFSWRWYFDTAKRCQLYDYTISRWVSISDHQRNKQ